MDVRVELLPWLSLAVRGRAAYPSGLGNEEPAHAAELLPPPHPQQFLPLFFFFSPLLLRETFLSHVQGTDLTKITL